MKNIKNKIIIDPELFRRKNKHKKIAMCHGVYDLFHIGHLQQFYFAKKKADILVVSITHEKYVNKDIRRPLFDIEKRMDIIASNSIVDYVIISSSKHGDKNIEKIKPNFYLKDQEYKNIDDLGIKIEKQALKKINGKLIFSKLEKFSSSKIYDYYYNLYSDKKFSFLKKDLNSKSFFKILEKLKKTEISVIGEFIIDSYENTKLLGVPSKSTCLSVLSLDKQTTYGGAYAIAKHLSGFVKKVNLYTNMSSSLKKKLSKSNINIINIHDENFEKKRLIEKSTQNRIVETSYDFQKTSNFVKNFKMRQSGYNKSKMVLVADYGQNFINKNFLNKIFNKKKFFATNIQSNSYNRGFNYLSLYKKSNFIVIDKHELSINFRTQNIKKPHYFMKKLATDYKCPVSVTVGGEGAIALENNKFFELEAFSKTIIDSVGAGDAYYALSSLFYFQTKNIKLATLAGSIAAAIATKYIGNKEYVTYKDIVSNMKKFFQL